ncbi:MAG: sigma-54-dependent Fis family transcriptional regulator [Syntrophobacterales bacterium]|nr:MAG: sigma-54-dependent Fis family transcriptional regulator [Syntrophobacterales bacterium]
MIEKRPTVLIVDDDESMRDTLEAILKKEYAVIKAEDGERALRIAEIEEVNVILLDIMLPGMGGLEVLEKIKARFEDIDVIMITVVKDIDSVVKAMKLGAYDYIGKDFDYDEVITLVDRVIEKQKKDRELIYLHSEMERYIEYDFILGKTPQMKEVYDVIQKVARLPATVLIRGESGTGKELVARIIHRESALSENPFVTISLASIPNELIESTLFGHEKGAFTGAHRQRFGKFELAHKGTLFLDEIGDLRFDLQAKLLRAIQEGEIERVGGTKTIKVDVRLIAATSINLEGAVKEGDFREDLFYRINVIPINLPPLRNRLADTPQLVELFIKRYNKKFRKRVKAITQGALSILCNYNWPGNIRELENLIERVIAISDGDMISEGDIPIEYYLTELIPPKVSKEDEGLFTKACETFERNFILKVLEKNRWRRKKTAKSLGIPLSTLKYKLNKLHIYDLLNKKEKEPAE